MSLKRNGVILDCQHCRCTACGDRGEFDIVVPLSEPASGTGGSATLHCSVAPGQHRVTLLSWRDAAGRPVSAGAATQRRVDATLQFVASHRICGSRQLCPAEIADLVNQAKRQR